MPTPFVPEVRLHLAEDAIVWWARMEAAAGHACRRRSGRPPGPAARRWPATSWTTRSWPPAAGCSTSPPAPDWSPSPPRWPAPRQVIANDIDPYAVAAVTLNARGQRRRRRRLGDDLLDGDGGEADLVVAGDVFYDRAMADRMLPFLQRAAAAGCRRAGRRPRPGAPADGPPDRAGRLPGAHHRTVGRLVATPGAGAAPRLRRTATRGDPEADTRGHWGLTTRCPKWCHGHSVDA